MKDDIENGVFETIENLRDATLPTLKRYWDDVTAVLRLIGREWILFQANASKKNSHVTLIHRDNIRDLSDSVCLSYGDLSPIRRFSL